MKAFSLSAQLSELLRTGVKLSFDPLRSQLSPTFSSAASHIFTKELSLLKPFHGYLLEGRVSRSGSIIKHCYKRKDNFYSFSCIFSTVQYNTKQEKLEMSIIQVCKYIFPFLPHFLMPFPVFSFPSLPACLLSASSFPSLTPCLLPYFFLSFLASSFPFSTHLSPL